MNKKIYRHGDVNLHEIKEIPQGLKLVNHQGNFVLARGEATGSVHLLEVAEKSDMVLMQDEKGNTYIQLLKPAKLSHTKDHETITIQPGIYKQIQEREIDWFEKGITKKVVD